MNSGISVTTIDCDYVYPRFASSFLVIDRSGVEPRAVIIETNTVHAQDKILNALSEQGLVPGQVDWIFVTHAHLDHAAGAGGLMQICTNAKLGAHPRAARHLIDPSKLVTSAKQVYGEANFSKLYGEISPIPPERVQTFEDDAVLEFASLRFKFLHTQGHAKHHFCILMEEKNSEKIIFTGDTFGLCYPDIQQFGLFVFPSTSPTDFDPAQALNSIDRVVASGASKAYLTHFGKLENLSEASEQLRSWIKMSEEVMRQAMSLALTGAPVSEFCQKRLAPQFEEKLKTKGFRGAQFQAAWNLIKLDLELNAQGIAYAAQKLREGQASGNQRV